MNKAIKRTIGFVLAFVVCVSMLSLSMCAYMTEAFAEGQKTPLLIDPDFADTPGSGHAHPSATGQLGEEFDKMWKALSITVTDSKGNVYDVPHEFCNDEGVKSEKDINRLGGLYEEGEELTITVDTSGLPEGYHISYSPVTKSEQKYFIKGGYYKFKIKYTHNSKDKMKITIPMGAMSVKFDLQGGNVLGNTDAIINKVKKDNSVDFPSKPMKKDLNFGGWYTKMPEAYQGNPLPEPGKMYLWNEEDRFSDYNRDWKLFNDPNDDPLYDGIFLLRALWNAEVEFDSNGGSPVYKAVVKEGEKVLEPEAPVKKYAEFLGWTTEDGKDYDFSKPVTKNMALKAKWNNYTMPKGKDIEINVGDKFKPEDGIKNKDKLPKGTTIETKDIVDTSKSGAYDVTLLVKYPNGDIKEVAIKVTVKGKNNGGNTAPKTGDTSDILLYDGLLAIMSMNILFILRKKNYK